MHKEQEHHRRTLIDSLQIKTEKIESSLDLCIEIYKAALSHELTAALKAKLRAARALIIFC